MDVKISACGNRSSIASTTFSEPPGTVSHSCTMATRAELNVEGWDKAIRSASESILLDGPGVLRLEAPAAVRQPLVQPPLDAAGCADPHSGGVCRMPRESLLAAEVTARAHLCDPAWLSHAAGEHALLLTVEPHAQPAGLVRIY